MRTSVRTAGPVWSAGVLVLATLLAAGPARAQAPTPGPQAADSSSLAARFVRVAPPSEWRQVRAVPLGFPTFHPQGLAKVGEDFFLSSVEVTTRPAPLDGAPGGYDRTSGEGVGHLFRFDARGELVEQIRLGEGTMYHPGGVDHDGRYLWVPVAEYRSGSRSVIYRVDPRTMDAVVVTRFDDHLGAVVVDPDEATLTGMNWDARRFYTWKLAPDGRSVEGGAPLPGTAVDRSGYVAYQDCQYAGARAALCGGLRAFDVPGAGRVALGGLELADLASAAPRWQLPLPLYARPGVPMTQNPFFAETTDEGLRFYFIPEDDASTMYVFEAPLR